MVSIYADGADLARLEQYADDIRIHGFTTNPSLMKKAGITNYRDFARTVLGIVKGKPVSFEVLADDLREMEKQARVISEWGANIQVKIPITNTKADSTLPVIESLQKDRISVNVTAVMTMRQIDLVRTVLREGIISVFAGRIADTGRDPKNTITYAKKFNTEPDVSVLWASAREILNVSQADEAGADIITLTPDLITKLDLHGKSLEAYSLETVKMFHEDGQGVTI
jgi:transaldolase